MKKRNALTLVEVLLIIGILIFLLVILIPAFERQPRPARTIVCLHNLKQLSLAWVIYADDNDGKIINGAAGNERLSEPSWTGKDWADDYREGGALAPKEQEEAIRSGTLWPYIKNVKYYCCPTSISEKMRTYSIVDSLNGVPQPGDPKGRGPAEAIDKLIVKDLRQIRDPNMKAAFTCVGWTAPGNYGVYYDKEKWWDLPYVQHGINRTTVSFMDGHVDRWKWKGEETVKLGKSMGPKQLSQHVEPQTVEGKEDLQKVQMAVWGKLGYNPSAID
jgi:type II secretory pathway pseudopilin PulG